MSLSEWTIVVASLVAGACSVRLVWRAAASRRASGERVRATLLGALAALMACALPLLLVEVATTEPGRRSFHVAATWPLVLALLCSAPLVPALLYVGVRWALDRRRLQGLAALSWVTAVASAYFTLLQGMRT